MKKIILPVLLMLYISACSQNTVDADFPQPRSGAAFVYHPVQKALMLVGGLATVPSATESDIWKWNGKAWSKTKAYGPGSIDYSQAIAFDRQNGLIYSFAGYDMFDDFKNDLWTSNGDAWSQAKVTVIGGRIHHAMVYADHLNAFVEYGGFTENRESDTTTWLMKDGIFTALQIPGPGYRHQFGMAYDRHRQKVVLYGGTEGSDELWEFDGAAWKKIINPPVNPGTRMRHTMVYDDQLKMVILHGGDPRDVIPTTWGWNGKTWRKITQANLYPIVMGYDEARKVVVAYGQNENSELCIWELTDNQWKVVHDYGKWNAESFRNNWMRQHPEDVSPLAQYSFDLLFFKKFQEAEQGYKKIEKVYPQKASVLVNLVRILLLQGKTGEAKLYVGKIDQQCTIKRYLSSRLASYLSEAKLYAESVRYFEKALAAEPQGSDFYNLACVYARMGDNDKAFEHLENSVVYGFNSKERFEGDADLITLKDDARWKSIVNKLK